MNVQATRRMPGASSIVNIEDYTKAMLNILEDSAEEKERLKDAYRAALNILEDFSEEKNRFTEVQRAMLNLLDDFGMEREKTEAINRELRIAEERIKKSLREKESLLKEVHHRVKNNLQIIHSLLNLQLPYIRDEYAVKAFKDSQNRIFSMALIHEKLYQSESLARIDLSEYIPSLVSNLFISYGANEAAIRAELHVEKISLDIDTVIPCALIINELVSNSLKHAFPDTWRCTGEAGVVRIDLYSGAGDELVLMVKDNGMGLPEGMEIQSYETLGLKLVTILVKQLSGAIRVSTNGGTEFMITFKPFKKRE
ncbi:MAG: sensor histidine kinase [Candidatus Latescibacterota bacterium]